MLAKKTSKNQVTLPKKALQNIPETDYFDITAQGGVLILRPVNLGDPGSRLAAVRQKIKDLGFMPKDLDRAIAWARGHRGRRR
jgi:virulence-associated protein VagC